MADDEIPSSTADDMLGGDAGTHKDSKDQIFLREVVLTELSAVLAKYDCGGVLFISSKESAAWKYIDPAWTGIYTQPIPQGGVMLRVRVQAKSNPAQANWATGHIAHMRDMCAQAFNRFDRLWKMVENAVGKDAIHHPFANMSSRPKPPKGSA